MSTSSRRPKAGSAKRTGTPTIGDVATLAGVSKMSVSRVLRDRMNVAEPLRGRIERAILHLNYVPNRAAQLLSGVSQFKIGVLYNQPRSAYAIDLLLGSMDQAAVSDAQILMRGCTFDIDDADVLQDLLSQKVSAVILTPPLCECSRLIVMLAEAGTLAVLVGTSTRPGHGLAMHIDEFAAAYEMTRHIVALGHQRIGFIEGGRALSASMQRFAGYRAALKESGIDRDDSIVVPGLFTYRSGLEAAERLLSMPDRPTAVFASNDDMAAATVATAHRLGLDVPREVTVCGFDDSWIATSIWPELTTVRQPVAEMGARAIRFVREMFLIGTAVERAADAVIFPHEIILRESDGPAPPR